MTVAVVTCAVFVHCMMQQWNQTMQICCIVLNWLFECFVLLLSNSNGICLLQQFTYLLPLEASARSLSDCVPLQVGRRRGEQEARQSNDWFLCGDLGSAQPEKHSTARCSLPCSTAEGHPGTCTSRFWLSAMPHQGKHYLSWRVWSDASWLMSCCLPYSFVEGAQQLPTRLICWQAAPYTFLRSFCIKSLLHKLQQHQGWKSEYSVMSQNTNCWQFVAE